MCVYIRHIDSGGEECSQFREVIMLKTPWIVRLLVFALHVCSLAFTTLVTRWTQKLLLRTTTLALVHILAWPQLGRTCVEIGTWIIGY